MIAIAITAVACAAMFFAARSGVTKAAESPTNPDDGHFRQVLAGIDADLAAGKLGTAEAEAAKGELAREILRTRSDASHAPIGILGRVPLVGGLVCVAAIAFGIYGLQGSPQLPSQPLSGRPEVVAQTIDLETAIGRIEAQLAANPDDLRGWTVIAPAYTELGRYADAVRAYRRIIDLGGASANAQTSLAEALLLEADGAGSDEAMSLLRTATANAPDHVLSRLYLAAELTRTADYPEAAATWQAALALSKGDEPWLAAARQGLLVAQNDGAAPAGIGNAEIAGMVSGLADRLAANGGSVEEWTQLVRAYIVLGDLPAAQTAYDSAIAAYPLAFDRGEMDTIALDAGLTLNGASR